MSDVTTQDGTFLTKKDLAMRWHCRERSVELWVRQGKVPPPLKIGDRKALWSLNEIIDHEIAVKAGRKPVYETALA